MRFPNLGEPDLLVPLHDGMFEQPMWQTFLARLQSIAGARRAALVMDAGGGSSFETGPGPNPDPAALREGRVHHGGEIGLASTVRVIGFDGPENVRGCLLLDFARPPGADVARLLDALLPHLRVALRVFVTLERERARSSTRSEAMSRLNFGWMSLDRRCRIVDSDEQAERFLERSGSLKRGPYDRLTPSSPHVDRTLTALVRSFAEDAKARPQAINLSHDPWTDILVAPLRVPALAGAQRAVAAIYFRGDRSSSADRVDQLSDIFDLSPSEARLAWSMAQGLSIAEAAEEHGLTIETARNYSKRIYAKMGARGQVDMVRNILTGVLALA